MMEFVKAILGWLTGFIAEQFTSTVKVSTERKTAVASRPNEQPNTSAADRRRRAAHAARIIDRRRAGTTAAVIILSSLIGSCTTRSESEVKETIRVYFLDSGEKYKDGVKLIGTARGVLFGPDGEPVEGDQPIELDVSGMVALPPGYARAAMQAYIESIEAEIDGPTSP